MVLRALQLNNEGPRYWKCSVCVSEWRFMYQKFRRCAGTQNLMGVFFGFFLIKIGFCGVREKFENPWVYCFFLVGKFTRKINGRFWWNSDHPDMTFSMEFSIPSICYFWWNLENSFVFEYFLFKQFSSFTLNKQRIISLLRTYFLPKYFLTPHSWQKMSFLMKFWGN